MDGEAFSSPMVVPGTALVPRESSTVIVEDSLDDDSNKQDFVERDSIARERTQACVQDNNKLKLEIPPQTLRIGIVGGGLGGLACALALQQAGFYNVTVFEADERFSDRREGFGLTLTNNKKGPLAKLGLLRDCIQHDCASNEHWVFNPTGKVLGYYGRGLLSSSPNSNVAVDDSDMIMTTERGNLRIPRQALRRMLLSRLKTNTVQWGKRLISYDERANVPIKATFRGYSSENLETQEASVDVDVLIGADGLRSVVRTIRDACNPDLSPAPLRYIGVSVIIGLSTACHKLLDSCGFYILDGVHRLFVMPYSTEKDGNPAVTMWQLSFSGVDDDEATKFRSCTSAELRHQALARTSGWMSPVKELIEETLDSEIWGTGLYDRDAMSMKAKKASGPSSKKRKIAALEAELTTETEPAINSGKPLGAADTCVTVLGDACHPMSMFKGQGCNQAMEDGPLLASWLAKPGLTRYNLSTRLRCFEREMIARANSKVF
jgi:salicylate hydroxylase